MKVDDGVRLIICNIFIAASFIAPELISKILCSVFSVVYLFIFIIFYGKE